MNSQITDSSIIYNLPEINPWSVHFFFFQCFSCPLNCLHRRAISQFSGGYVFTNIEDVEQNATGFRINGLYEFNPMEGMLAHGISMGYLRTTASNTVNSQTADYTLSSFPVYYAPKVMFGGESFKVFIKGALGCHYSAIKGPGNLHQSIHGILVSTVEPEQESWKLSMIRFSLMLNMSGLILPIPTIAVASLIPLWVVSDSHSDLIRLVSETSWSPYLSENTCRLALAADNYRKSGWILIENYYDKPSERPCRCLGKKFPIRLLMKKYCKNVYIIILNPITPSKWEHIIILLALILLCSQGYSRRNLKRNLHQIASKAQIDSLTSLSKSVPATWFTSAGSWWNTWRSITWLRRRCSITISILPDPHTW